MKEITKKQRSIEVQYCGKCGRGSEIIKPENCFFCGGMTPSVEPHEKRYCSRCGVLCIEQMLGVELNMMFYDTRSSISLNSEYDKRTGQRNYCYKYICPNWKKKFWELFYSPHDNYIVDKVVNM